MKPSDYKYAVSVHHCYPLDISIEHSIYCVEFALMQKHNHFTVPFDVIKRFLEGIYKIRGKTTGNVEDTTDFSNNTNRMEIVLSKNKKTNAVKLIAYNYDIKILEIVNKLRKQLECFKGVKTYIEIEAVHPAYFIKPNEDNKFIQKKIIKLIEYTIEYGITNVEPDNVILQYWLGSQFEYYEEAIYIVIYMSKKFVKEREYTLNNIIDKDFGSTIKKYCKFKFLNELKFQELYRKKYEKYDNDHYLSFLNNIYKYIEEGRVGKAEEHLIRNGFGKSMYTHNFTNQLFG